MRGKAQKWLDIVKKIFLPKMPEIIYETDVYIGILLSESPFIQKSRIQVLENVNWRKPFKPSSANWRILMLRLQQTNYMVFHADYQFYGCILSKYI